MAVQGRGVFAWMRRSRSRPAFPRPGLARSSRPPPRSRCTAPPSWPPRCWLSNMAARLVFLFGSIVAACWRAPGSLARAEQGIFSYWLHAHAAAPAAALHRFRGHGIRCAMLFIPAIWPLAASPIRRGATQGPCFTMPAAARDNAMSLAQLTRWCDQRFGKTSGGNPICAHAIRHSMDGHGLGARRGAAGLEAAEEARRHSR